MLRRFPITVGVMLIAVPLVFAALAGVGPASAQAAPGTVTEIVVEGVQRIESGTVRSYMLVQPGDAFDPQRIDKSLKSLFATGLFADVSVKRSGTKLIVAVVENPVINRIAFEGNRKLKDDDLKTEVSLRPRVIYTRTKVQNDVQRILTLYRRSGRFAATVEPKVIQLPQNRVDLVFEISEGKPTEIRSIRFIGNKEFSDSDLREEIRTRESRWYRILSSDDTYDPDRLTLDRELLRRYYLANGFADFRVISALAELTPDRENFFITFTVDEGNRYAFGEIKVVARIKDLQPEQVQDEIKAESGDWYDSSLVDDGIDALTDAVGNLGHAFVEVRPIVNRKREEKIIDVTFEINDGPRVFVERIEIAGNVRTLDQVIRREFRLVEGDAFNASRLRRSRQRIQNLNFFKTVNVERVPGSAPDKAVVQVEVEEKSSGSLSIGAGYSTTNGPLADFGIRESNLLGRGQDLRLKVVAAQRQSRIDVGFTEPYFMNREVAAGFDVFHSSTDLQDTSSFNTDRTGGAVRAGYPITENLRQYWRYAGERSSITKVSSNASEFVKAEKGVKTLSAVSHTLSYDQRDNRPDPTEGYFVSMTNEFAGVGGNRKFTRNALRGGKYFPLADKWVLGLLGSAGYIIGIGQDVSLLDRFFLGGDDLRGFATSGAGPRDTTTDDALGGEWRYAATAELRFPLGLPEELQFKGKLFTDIGSTGKLSASGPNVRDSGSLRASVGTGVTWVSPIGPIGVDIGFPVIKESFDVTETFRVNFGTRF